MEFLEIGSRFFEQVMPWMISLWWLYIFIGLILLLPFLWLSYAQEYYKKTALKPVILEIKVPRELERSPRAMEQIFTQIHALRNSASNVEEKWWQGEVPLWFSFEVASFGGEIHFFIRIPSRHRNIVEAAFYASYPDVEISDVREDYIKRFPKSVDELFAKKYRFFGNELLLAKSDAYPIRTYYDFETPEDESKLDPVAGLMEVMAKIGKSEDIWVQVIARPLIDDSWREEGAKLIQGLKERAKTEFETSSGKFVMTDRSPGDIDTLKAIERNLSKPGFDVVIRYLYIAPDSVYTTNFGQRGVFSAFNQYMTENLNKFRHNYDMWTRSSFWYPPYLFPKRRLKTRQTVIWERYRKRHIYDKLVISRLREMHFFSFGFKVKNLFKGGALTHTIVLNTEELATIYHLPTKLVLTAPIMKRMEAKRVGPPAGLPIFGNDGESGNLPIK